MAKNQNIPFQRVAVLPIVRARPPLAVVTNPRAGLTLTADHEAPLSGPRTNHGVRHVTLPTHHFQRTDSTSSSSAAVQCGSIAHRCTPPGYLTQTGGPRPLAEVPAAPPSARPAAPQLRWRHLRTAELRGPGPRHARLAPIVCG